MKTDRMVRRDELVDSILATLPLWSRSDVLAEVLYMCRCRESRGESVSFMDVLEEWAAERATNEKAKA